MMTQEMMVDLWGGKKYHRKDMVEKVFDWLDRQEEERRIVEAAENAAKAYMEKNLAAELDRRSVERMREEFFKYWR